MVVASISTAHLHPFCFWIQSLGQRGGLLQACIHSGQLGSAFRDRPWYWAATRPCTGLDSLCMTVPEEWGDQGVQETQRSSSSTLLILVTTLSPNHGLLTLNKANQEPLLPGLAGIIMKWRKSPPQTQGCMEWAEDSDDTRATWRIRIWIHQGLCSCAFTKEMTEHHLTLELLCSRWDYSSMY